MKIEDEWVEAANEGYAEGVGFARDRMRAALEAVVPRIAERCAGIAKAEADKTRETVRCNEAYRERNGLWPDHRTDELCRSCIHTAESIEREIIRKFGVEKRP